MTTIIRFMGIAAFAFTIVSLPGELRAAPTEPGPTPPPPSYADRINQALAPLQPRLDACSKLPAVPEHGSVKLAVTITSSGAVSSQTVVTTTLGAGVTHCIMQVVKEVVFPAPPSKDYKFEHTFTVPSAVIVNDRAAAPVVTDRYRTVLDQISIAACKQPGGPTGPGKVKLELSPAGEVDSATIVLPSAYGNTAVGFCIEKKYQHASFGTGTLKEYVYSFDLK